VEQLGADRTADRAPYAGVWVRRDALARASSASALAGNLRGAPGCTIEEMLRLRHEQYPSEVVPVTTASILPRGNFRVWIEGAGWSSILGGRSGADVAFTDRAGYHWIRRALGKLQEIPEDPLTYFQRWEMYGPYDLQTPEPVE
jgi:hypothetical protein